MCGRESWGRDRWWEWKGGVRDRLMERRGGGGERWRAGDVEGGRGGGGGGRGEVGEG